MRIMLNGGHFPGADPGAVGARVTEAEICRLLMELTAVRLRNCGFEVLTLQSDDLEAVCEASNAFASDIFISVHCNAAQNRAAHGTEVYAMSDAGSLLAEHIRGRLCEIDDLSDRGVKDGSWLYVLKATEAVAVLVETAFISNFDDETLLIDKPNEFAAAICEGVCDYIVERRHLGG